MICAFRDKFSIIIIMLLHFHVYYHLWVNLVGSALAVEARGQGIDFPTHQTWWENSLISVCAWGGGGGGIRVCEVPKRKKEIHINIEI